MIFRIRLLFLLFASLLQSGCDDKAGARSQTDNDPKNQKPINSGTDKPAKQEDIPPEVTKALGPIAEKQAKGLDGAQTVINRAFEIASANEKQKFFRIAVDVTFSNFNQGFDLDDIDIIDAKTQTNYGSDPTIQLLNADGTINQNNADWDLEKDKLRTLLTYSIPEKLEAIQLEYWGNKIVPKPFPVGKGDIQYKSSRQLPGVQFWPFPESNQYGDVFQRDNWLFARLSVGTAVVDLETWPPEIKYWNCRVLRSIDKHPAGGWAVLSRTGSTADDIKFPVWHHPKISPGDSSLQSGLSVSQNHLEGIAVIGNQIFAFDNTKLYEVVDGLLKPVEWIPEAKGVNSDFGVKFTHGHVKRNNGETLLLWDGNLYSIADGKIEKSWKLGINEPYEFQSIPTGESEFIYLEERELFQVKLGSAPKRIASPIENIMGIHNGPDGTILINQGDNNAGNVAVIFDPQKQNYITVHVNKISDKLSTLDFSTVHWNKKSDHFFFVSKGGIFTVPTDSLLPSSTSK